MEQKNKRCLMVKDGLNLQLYLSYIRYEIGKFLILGSTLYEEVNEFQGLKIYVNTKTGEEFRIIPFTIENEKVISRMIKHFSKGVKLRILDVKDELKQLKEQPTNDKGSLKAKR